MGRPCGGAPERHHQDISHDFCSRRRAVRGSRCRVEHHVLRVDTVAGYAIIHAISHEWYKSPEWKPTASAERYLHIDILRGLALYKKPSEALRSRAAAITPRMMSTLVPERRSCTCQCCTTISRPRHAVCVLLPLRRGCKTPQRNTIFSIRRVSHGRVLVSDVRLCPRASIQT